VRRRSVHTHRSARMHPTPELRREQDATQRPASVPQLATWVIHLTQTPRLVEVSRRSVPAAVGGRRYPEPASAAECRGSPGCLPSRRPSVLLVLTRREHAT